MANAQRPKCPICRRPLPAEAGTTAGTSTYPFCSPRCKWVDLGNWMDGRYVIAGPSVEDAELDDETLQALLREPS
jgi:endogenous inhibitor of DNA gyrase (YacG/DUF329 family)